MILGSDSTLGRMHVCSTLLCCALSLLLAAVPEKHVHAATSAKILRLTFQAAKSGFDPVKVSDYYSGTIIEAIFEPLLTYDYLARPVKLVPNVAEALPAISDDGRTYTVKLRRGIYFAEDPVFNGRRRELTASDFAYSIKRFLDPTLAKQNDPIKTNPFSVLEKLKLKS